MQLAILSVGETQHHKEARIQGISPHLLLQGEKMSHQENEISRELRQP